MSGLLIADVPVIRRSGLLLRVIMGGLMALLVWAGFAALDEVAIGEGKVTPASRSQIIQSLEGGILAQMLVREGDIVEVGQQLAVLDPLQARTAMEEAQVRIVALRAKAARLEAEMHDADDVRFDDDLQDAGAVIVRERQLFTANRRAFTQNAAQLRLQLQLAREELAMATPLLKSGAANSAEVLRMRQKIVEIDTRLAATLSEYYVALKADFAKTMAELEPLLKVREGRADQLRRTTITAPARGVVKDIRVSTIGGVVAAGGVVMEVVPLDDQLLVEARLSPRDIAFIHPGQEATVKITAYDSAIYGALSARVDRISPDTIIDDVDKRINYYRVYVLTDQGFLQSADGKRHPIMPGMVATAEIRTGRRTVMSYLLKPLNKAGEALRER